MVQRLAEKNVKSASTALSSHSVFAMYDGVRFVARSWANFICTLLLFFIFSTRVHAVTISVNFNSTQYFDFGTGIWNRALGVLHPPFNVYGYDTFPSTGPFDKTDFDIGNGEHGPFNSTTYDLFDEDGDSSNNVIVITTDSYPDGLNVTTFDLDPTMTLRPEGTLPLVIRSLSDIVIGGTIDCSGDDGQNPDGSVGVSATPGGQGRCGGADGGNGGWTGGAPTPGGLISASITGGQALNTGTGAGGVGGGGGGSHDQGGNVAQPGEDPNVGGVNDGGAAGADNTTDGRFDLLEGGAGGGGGDDQSGTARGGGGGAGGGVIVLLAAQDITIEAGGLVLANGGDGGGDNTLLAGGGGGGGGGSIMILAGRDFVNDNPAGPPHSIVATRGTGGVTSVNAANGGSGTDGRIWFSDSDAAPGGTGTEDPLAYLFDLGTVAAEEDATGFSITSKAYDTLSSRPTLTAINMVSQTTAANTVELYLASGDTSNFTPTFQLASTFLNQEMKRYWRFRVILKNTDHTQAAAKVTSLSFEYERPEISEYDFVSGCGRVGGSSSSPWWLALLSLSPLFLALVLNLGLRRRVRYEPIVLNIRKAFRY